MQFSVREVLTFLAAVLDGGAASRSTAAVFEIFVQHWDLAAEAPHWMTGRLWLLRLGTCLTLADLELLHLAPMPKSNSELVHQQFNAVVKKRACRG